MFDSSRPHGLRPTGLLRGLEWVAIAFSGDPGNDPFFAHRRRGNQSDCIRLREDGDGDDDDDDDPNAPESTVEPEGVSAG